MSSELFIEFGSWFKTDAAFAALVVGGAPALALRCEPFAVAYANPAALALFSLQTPDQLTSRLEKSADPGARRLRDLAASLKPGAPRLERLRLALRGGAELVTVLCRRIDQNGQGFLVLAAMGLRPSVQREMEAAAKAAAPETHFTPETHLTPKTPQETEIVEDILPVAALTSENPVTATPPDPFELLPQSPLRFLFQSGADGLITQISPEFTASALLGAKSAIGRPLAELPPQPELMLAAALAGQQTWRNIELNWPLAGLPATVPVVVSASPIVNMQKIFAGFRGFGIVHFDRVQRIAPAVADPEPVPEHEPAPVAMTEPPEAVPAPPPARAPAEQESGQESSNVVTLHPGKTALAPLSSSAEIVPLSSNERQAFRDIARALGARIEEDGRPPAVETPVAPRADASVEPAPRAAEEVPTAVQDAPALAESPEPAAMIQPVAAAPDLLAHGESMDMADDHPADNSDAHAPVAHDLVAHDLVAHDLGLGRNAELLFDRLPIGVLVSRGDVPIYVNQVLLDLLGYKDADQFHAEGGMTQMFTVPEGQAALSHADHRALALHTRSGETVTVDAHLQTILWDHDPCSLLSFRRAGENDLAPKLKALELDLRARESEARELHGILDTATDGIAVLDDTGHLLSLNRSGEALLGYEQAEVLGEPFTVLLAPESHAAAMDYLDGLKANGVASVLNDGRDVIGRERHGRAVPLFMTLGRVGQGANAKFCAVLRDVTHWKKAERELKEARTEAERTSAQKSDFLAKISHEIRTPLNAILGFTEVISQERFGPVGNERYKDYLKDIHASGTHVMSLVNDLLDLSKIESGNLDLNFASVNANKVVQDCVALMQPQATKERIIIRVSLAPRLPNIVADERSLRQIIINLLSNAVKFNDAGGQVIVSTALTDAGHAVIRVRDTGIGMNETDIERALEPFRQLETSRKANGTGLGLPLTKAMVEANRASFTIKSKRTEGTLVEVTFPPTRVLAE